MYVWVCVCVCGCMKWCLLPYHNFIYLPHSPSLTLTLSLLLSVFLALGALSPISFFSRRISVQLLAFNFWHIAVYHLWPAAGFNPLPAAHCSYTRISLSIYLATLSVCANMIAGGASPTSRVLLMPSDPDVCPRGRNWHKDNQDKYAILHCTANYNITGNGAPKRS